MAGIGLVSALGPASGNAAVMGGGASGGWWNNFGAIACDYAAFQPKGAVSLLASYTDLTGNGRDCAPGTAPTWDALNGWKFLGASAQYLDCGWAGPQDQTWSALAVYTNKTAGSWMWGHTDAGSNVSGFYPRFGDRVNQGGAQAIFAAPVGAAGVAGYAGRQGYSGGAPNGPLIGVSVRVGVQNNMMIGTNDPAGGHITAYLQAIVFYSCTLSAVEVAAVSALMAAL